MTTSIRSERDLPGGLRDSYDGRHERSRSRGDLLEARGEQFGRGGRDSKDGYRASTALPLERTRPDHRGDSGRPGGEDKEMHKGGGGGYGGGGRQGGGYEGGSGGYREGGGQRDNRGGGGGRGDDRGRGGAGAGGRGGFGSGPKVSTVSEGQTSMMQSNHFRFAHRARETGQFIFVYNIELGIFDAEREARFGALRSIDNELRKIFNKYLTYGRHLFSTTMVADEFILTASHEGTEGQITFRPYQQFSLDEQDIRTKDKAAVSDFMNKVVKSSLYEQDYKQIGRLPKFFNSKEKRDLNQFELIVWPGYTCQVKSLHDGVFLNIDTSTKFLQMRTVLQLLEELKGQRFSNEEINNKLCPKWDDSKSSTSGQSDVDSRRLVVITSYNSASYQIESIDFETSPATQQFIWKVKDPNTNVVTKNKLTLAQYMENRWKIKLAPWELKQPLLKLTQRGEPVYLIPSRCHEASLPANFTSDPNKMRSIREEMITEPIDRMQRISTLIESFSKAGVLEDWQLKVNSAFTQVRTKQLYHVKLLDSKGNARDWQEYEGKRFPHTQPLYLAKNCWSIVYCNRDYDNANKLFENMQQACGIFGIKVEEPQWIETPGTKPEDFINAIKTDVNPKSCKIVVIVVVNPADKKKIKAFLDKGGVPSQFIKSQLIFKAKIGVFSNLLKQMNAKLKQDLYRVKLPHCANSMLVGVDVIMNGRNKLVGCSATINKEMSQCLTKLYKQRPPTITGEERKVHQGKSLKELQEERTTIDRTEIIKNFIDGAVAEYFKANGGLPAQIIIYRDGMGGPTLTEKVKAHEVGVITTMLETKAPGYRPKIMYCLVDRNIQHRVFAKQGADILNPGPGTVVDTALVENQGDTHYDFYLIPHKATVATAQPVLYRSVYNTTGMSKDQFETTTYHLCYSYFNFAGPIKVPMVCMYAHKIAAYAQENKLMPNEGLASFLHFL